MKKRLKSLKLNNKGAGLITVIIALSFLTLLGLTVMTLAYTQSEMKSSDRTGREVAYNANGVVDQLLSGAQLAISDSIEQCYAETMVNYSAKRNTIETEFDTNYISALETWAPYHTVTTKDSTGKETDTKYYYVPSSLNGYDEVAASGTSLPSNSLTLFKNNPSDALIKDRIANGGDALIGGYNVTALERFVKAGFGGDVTVTSTSGQAVWDIANKKVTLKDLKVTYHRLMRNVTITTDIVMEFPDLGYVYEEDVNGGNFTNYAVIAAGKITGSTSSTAKLQLKRGDVTINGKAYADEIYIGTTANQFKAENDSTVISKGDITVRGSKAVSATATGIINGISDESLKAATELMYKSAFWIDNTSTLWANGITLTDNGIAALCYRSNIFNDLEFKKNGTKAVLMGEYYYGFGSSTEKSEESSSILFNGKSLGDQSATVLDTSQLGNLTLAGYAFIDNGTATGNVKTGESMSTKRSTKAYLAPIGMINYDTDAYKVNSNPEIFDLNNSTTDQEKFTGITNQLKGRGYAPNKYVLWTDGENDVTAADYGITIKPVSIPYAGYTLGYYFLEFNATKTYTAEQNANRYFRDYYDHNPDQIADLVNTYLELSNPEAAAASVDRETTNSNISSVGNTLKKFTNKIDLSPLKSIISFDDIKDEVAKKLTAFKNACITLSTTDSPDDLVESKRNANTGSISSADDEELKSRLGENYASGKYNTNPFYYYVNVNKINTMFSTLESKGYSDVKTVYFYGFVSDGSTYKRDPDHPVAVITREANFEINDAEFLKSVCIVIALNDVTVERDYDGLIMANGNIIIDASDGSMIKLTSDSAYVTKAASALCNNYTREELGLDELEGAAGGMPYEFVYGDFTPDTTDTTVKASDYWDVSTLAYYDKYKKN